MFFVDVCLEIRIEMVTKSFSVLYYRFVDITAVRGINAEHPSCKVSSDAVLTLIIQQYRTVLQEATSARSQPSRTASGLAISVLACPKSSSTTGLGRWRSHFATLLQSIAHRIRHHGGSFLQREWRVGLVVLGLVPP